MMEKIAEHCSLLWSPSPSSKQSRLNVAVVSTFLASVCFLSFRFSPSFLTLLVLIPSTLLLAKKKPDSNQCPAQTPLLVSGDDDSLFDKKPHRASEETAVQIEVFRPVETSSDGDSSNGALENGDFAPDLWMCLDELAHNISFSDDSSSEDDDSLIEIPLLPSANAIRTDFNREEVRNLETCLPDFLPDSVLRQQALVELLAEINEEENLIEIDISRGFNPFRPNACN